MVSCPDILSRSKLKFDRSSLAENLGHLRTIRAYRDRLRTISSEVRIAGSGASVSSYMVSTKTLMLGLSAALKELSELLTHLVADEPTMKIETELLLEIASTATALDESASPLCKVVPIASQFSILLDSKPSSHVRPRLLLTLPIGEQKIAQDATNAVHSAAQSLQQWCLQAPHLDAFIRPILTWLQAKEVPRLEQRTFPATDGSADDIIDTLLLNVQALLKVSGVEELASEERDNYLRDDLHAVSSMTSRLNLQIVSSSLCDLLARIPGFSEKSIENSLARLLPFLERYVSYAEAQLSNQSDWTKSMFKLTHVVSSIVSSVAKDGFCKPKDMEEGEDDGGGQEAGEGMGMGEGTGTENVSKEIQEESQVEGLQGEDAQGDEKVERAEEGNAIEMSEDIGGELQDVPQDEAEDEEKSDEESNADMDEGLGDLDGDDENAIDEKLWGDEKGPEDRDNGGKSDKDRSQKQAGKSEMVAKEGEEAKKDKEQPEASGQDGEAVDDTAEDTPEDQEAPGQDGAPLDDFTQEAETLELPDNMEIDGPDKQGEAADAEEDALEMNDEPDDQDGEPEPGSPGGPPEEDDPMDVDEGGMQQASNDDVPEDQQPEGEDREDAVAQPDTHAGDGVVNEDTVAGEGSAADASNANKNDASMPDSSTEQAGTASGERSEETQSAEKDPSECVVT